ncbi:sensor histidine kinase [Actinotalea solisilvae]|uniref:sensor histidine kinase n=1 Tax=Actinotalea solisilvae TaxID=2072922 RepID=UPI0018F1805F|nr:HAMP domain-containing sensor histidine kinase [Actinotalea solisilvae]
MSTADARAGGPAAPRRRRRLSVRARLTLLTSGLLCVTLAVGAVALTTVLSRSRVAQLDEAVRAGVATVALLVADDRVPPALPVAEAGQIAQVLDASGRVLASSATASRTLPVLPVAEVDRLLAAASSGGTGATDGTDVHVATTDASAYDDAARVAVVPATLDGAPVRLVVTVPLTEVQGLLRALAVALGGVVPLLTALLGAVVWVVLGRVLAPVEALRRAAEQVARTGGPGSLPVVRADDEIGALARTLNEMLDRLEGAAARQRAFVADAAHELRSPLAALRAATDVARAHPDAYPPDELADELGAEVLRMQHLVDDLLLLARVGSVPARLSDVDLTHAVGEALAVARAAAEAAGRRVEVTVDVPPAGAGAVGDPAAVTRVVRNLLDNALRHAGAHVRVTVRPGRVVVDDDGPGVAPEDRERVFERFVRLGAARERDSGGSGLGLAIAREVARENGGDVTLAEAPGGGLRAELTLPAAGAASPPGHG